VLLFKLYTESKEKLINDISSNLVRVSSHALHYLFIRYLE